MATCAKLVGDSSAGIVTNTGTLKAGTVQGQARSVLQAGAIEANSVNLGASYALVFLALQPLQQVMQRAFGPGAALMRGLGLFVAAAAVAVYLRNLLAGLPPA